MCGFLEGRNSGLRRAEIEMLQVQVADIVVNFLADLFVCLLVCDSNSPSGDPGAQAISGSSPDWQKNTLRDLGKRKIESRPHGFLESHGLKECFHDCNLREPAGRFDFSSQGKTLAN